MHKIPYKNFRRLVIRTPLFPVSFYKELTSGSSIQEERLKEICRNRIVSEALYLASPFLFGEIDRWLNNEMVDSKDEENLRNSILKYLSRLSARCTPFGLFAGWSTGEFGKETKIHWEGPDKNLRHTRLDMNYLVALSQDLANRKEIREQILFFPNSTIYSVGNELRYMEFKYHKSVRAHQIVSIERTDLVVRILNEARGGILLKDLSSLLAGEYSVEEIASFLEELANNEVLVNELEPSVSGYEFFDQLYNVLSKLKGSEDLLSDLEKIRRQIQDLDRKIGNNPGVYMDVRKSLEKLGTAFDPRFLFQVDMMVNARFNLVNERIIDSVAKALSILNKLTLPEQNSRLTKFKDEFFDRFDDREVPISKAVDVEMGIEYNQMGDSAAEQSPLVKDLIVPQGTMKSAEIRWTTISSLLHKKILEAYQNDNYVISLKESDLKGLEENWNDLPDTLSVMIAVMVTGEKEKMRLIHCIGSSAANMLGRFSHADKKLHSFINEIVEAETEMNKGKIVAEIVHLPESRVGNILLRQAFRKFEIPYLARSIVPRENQLPVEDLCVSVTEQKQIRLRSAQYKCEVLPRLTNAHNFSYGSLPVYNLLADLQTEGKRNVLGINWGPLESNYEFLPRLEYEDVILKEATWNIKTATLDSIWKAVSDPQKLISELRSYRSKRKMPQFLLLVESDHELLVNLENSDSIKMLLGEVQNLESFKLAEFLFNTDSTIGEINFNQYNHQIIIPFYNSKKLNEIRQI